MTGIKIRGTGRYLPERVITNEEYAAFLKTSDDWILSHTGISRRRIAVEEPCWLMGAKAAEQALESAGVLAADVDIIVGTTVTADYAFPSMACMVQEYLGNRKAFAMDLAAACAGSVCALDLARQYLAAGEVKTILIVSSEQLTQTSDFEDRGSCILFGDGAAAMVVSAADKLYGSFLRSDAAGGKHLYLRRERAKTPFSGGEYDYGQDPFRPGTIGRTWMDGHEVYRWAPRAMAEAVREACVKVGMDPAELDLILPHQANIRIIKTAMRNLRLPMERVYVNIQEYGNTSSASIPICLDECVREGRLKQGDRFCMVGFGAGLIYAAVVMEY